MYKIFVAILLILASFTAVAQDSTARKEKASETKLTGEVTDVKCFVSSMASEMGDDHKQCAIDCIKGGLPVGIMDSKTKKLYIVVPAKGMKGANEELVKYADQKVSLTGNFVEKNGAKIFFYTKVEEAK